MHYESADSLRRVAMRFGPPDVHDVRTRHDVFDEAAARVTTVDFDLEAEESDGKLLTLAAPIVDALENGFVVVIDELDARMHPLLTHAIVALFHDKERHPRNAQLVFASHDGDHARRSPVTMALFAFANTPWPSTAACATTPRIATRTCAGSTGRSRG